MSDDLSKRCKRKHFHPNVDLEQRKSSVRVEIQDVPYPNPRDFFSAFSNTVEEKAKWLFEKLKGEGFYTIALPSIFNFPCCYAQSFTSHVVAHLLKPRGWKPPVRKQFFLDCNEISELCDSAERIFTSEPTVLQIKAPVKIFGDLHGQFGDLMRLFDEYGAPSTAGDISVKAVTDCNYSDPRLFNWLPLAALMEKKVICMHGGIGHSINHVEQIENVQRPITMETGAIVLMDLLWSYK
ncbi:hypothetical protein ZIOFF_011164 [Zingiber officinale]|uniref:Serine/threonine specific protein phosphatases domain-containing protein n=1 Tax=Zingiber officinale TaxID=94328 RepID=A0A8J5HX78_ZINOF|nr:hypothetical protein ZIOFF_011164 [Zingiber officinale]